MRFYKVVQGCTYEILQGYVMLYKVVQGCIQLHVVV